MEKFYTFCRETEKKLKMFKDRVVLFPVKFFDLLHIRPFYVSLTALIFGFLSVYFLVLGRNYLFLLMILLKTLFDSLDGPLVRYKGKEYGQGFWLDYGFDRTITVSILFSVFLLQGKTFFYLLPLLTYVIVHLIYAFNIKRLIMIYTDTLYYIFLTFNVFYASSLSIVANILNLLLFVLYLSVFLPRKKHS